MTKKNFTPKLIKGLDLIYMGNGEGHENPVRGIKVTKGSETRTYNPNELKSFLIFCAMVDLSGVPYFPCPILSEGLPKKEDTKVEEYQGLIPSSDYPIIDEFLHVGSRMEGKISKSTIADKYVAYLGGMQFVEDIIWFDQPIPFDPVKQLVFVRSPNKKLKLEGMLQRTFEEGCDKAKYNLLYTNLAELKDRRRWARNSYFNGLNPIFNKHLF